MTFYDAMWSIPYFSHVSDVFFSRSTIAWTHTKYSALNKISILRSSKILNYASGTPCDNSIWILRKGQICHNDLLVFCFVCWKIPPKLLPQPLQTVAHCQPAPITFEIRYNFICSQFVQTNQWTTKAWQSILYITSRPLSKLNPVINQSRMHKIFIEVFVPQCREGPAQIECSYCSSQQKERWMYQLCGCSRSTFMQIIPVFANCILRCPKNWAKWLRWFLPFYFYYIDRCSWLMRSLIQAYNVFLHIFFSFSSFTTRCRSLRCLQLSKSCFAAAAAAAAGAAIPTTSRWPIR